MCEFCNGKRQKIENGCCIERETADKYGIKAYTIPVRYVIDDYNALLNRLHPVCGDTIPTF